ALEVRRSDPTSPATRALPGRGGGTAPRPRRQPMPNDAGAHRGTGPPRSTARSREGGEQGSIPCDGWDRIGTNSGRSPGHPCGAYLVTVAFGAPIARYRSDLVTSPAEKNSGSSAPPAHSR